MDTEEPATLPPLTVVLKPAPVKSKETSTDKISAGTLSGASEKTVAEQSSTTQLTEKDGSSAVPDIIITFSAVNGTPSHIKRLSEQPAAYLPDKLVRKTLTIVSKNGTEDSPYVTHPSGIISKSPFGSSDLLDPILSPTTASPIDKEHHADSHEVSSIVSPLSDPFGQAGLTEDGDFVTTPDAVSFQTVPPHLHFLTGPGGIPAARPTPSGTAEGGVQAPVGPSPLGTTWSAESEGDSAAVTVTPEQAWERDGHVTRPFFRPVTSYSGVYPPSRPKPPSLPHPEYPAVGGESDSPPSYYDTNEEGEEDYFYYDTEIFTGDDPVHSIFDMFSTRKPLVLDTDIVTSTSVRERSLAEGRAASVVKYDEGATVDDILDRIFETRREFEGSKENEVDSSDEAAKSVTESSSSELWKNPEADRTEWQGSEKMELWSPVKENVQWTGEEHNAMDQVNRMGLLEEADSVTPSKKWRPVRFRLPTDSDWPRVTEPPRLADKLSRLTTTPEPPVEVVGVSARPAPAAASTQLVVETDNEVGTAAHPSAVVPTRPTLASLLSNYTYPEEELTPPGAGCPGDQFRCVSGECIPRLSRCDLLRDCADGSDEMVCTCADRLNAQFLERKICDGIIDCHDSTDEQFCDWCQPGQFICPGAKRCVPAEAVCDGQYDCPDGADEHQCVTLATSRATADQRRYQSAGYLMVRRRGQWGPLCVDDFDALVRRTGTDWSVQELGKAVCNALTYK
ncbi:Serine protease nudel [Amphibalanus amphitrite]|uniref:Serine protease nudel n=1 Tax=Amphibalanus amphitrite TaxID=1232801 RepID=A0A6A4V4J8_AMPAM|nr:Serine protease nudel [Amphibalanus amphitrite]